MIATTAPGLQATGSAMVQTFRTEVPGGLAAAALIPSCLKLAGLGEPGGES